MDVTRPYADVIPGARGQLLAALVQLETPVTVRALARHAAISPQRALDLVDDLREAGLAVVERADPALMVSLNRHHLAAEPLLALVASRKRLVDRLTEDLAGWRGVSGAWLYGSTARGDGGRDADVDLLLVAEESIEDRSWVEGVTRLRDRVLVWTGNEPQIVEHTRSSYEELIEEGNPLIAAVRADGISLINSQAVVGGAP